MVVKTGGIIDDITSPQVLRDILNDAVRAR